jgi:hypothetical protein
MPERKTIVYTQSGCPACHRETKFLAQKGVECIFYNGPRSTNPSCTIARAARLSSLCQTL